MSRNNSQPFHRNCLINRMLKASGESRGLPDLKKEQEKWEDDFFKEFEKELKNKKNNLIPEMDILSKS